MPQRAVSFCSFLVQCTGLTSLRADNAPGQCRTVKKSDRRHNGVCERYAMHLPLSRGISGRVASAQPIRPSGLALQVLARILQHSAARTPGDVTGLQAKPFLSFPQKTLPSTLNQTTRPATPRDFPENHLSSLLQLQASLCPLPSGERAFRIRMQSESACKPAQYAVWPARGHTFLTKRGADRTSCRQHAVCMHFISSA